MVIEGETRIWIRDVLLVLGAGSNLVVRLTSNLQVKLRIRVIPEEGKMQFVEPEVKYFGCIQAIAATAILVEENSKHTFGSKLVVCTPHVIQGALNQRKEEKMGKEKKVRREGRS